MNSPFYVCICRNGDQGNGRSTYISFVAIGLSRPFRPFLRHGNKGRQTLFPCLRRSCNAFLMPDGMWYVYSRGGKEDVSRDIYIRFSVIACMGKCYARLRWFERREIDCVHGVMV